jgi:nucleoside-diphosphate-sugar epimerase
MSKVVVTGGMGFLGSALVLELLNRGLEVVILDRHGTQQECDAWFGKGVTHCPGSILDMDSLVNAFAGAEGVYHMAGGLGTAELNSLKIQSVEINVIGSLNVFEAALQAGVRYVFSPSKPNVWLNSYTITKVAVEEFSKLYNQETPLKIYSLRYFNAYGPGQHLMPVRKVVPYFALQARLKKPLEIFGSGEQTVDMVYRDDVAWFTVEFVSRCQASGVTPGIPDLGRGVAMTVNEIADAVNAYFGQSGVVHIPMRNGETPDTKLVADLAPLRTVIESPFADWGASWKETLDYYAELPQEVVSRAAAYFGI